MFIEMKRKQNYKILPINSLSVSNSNEKSFPNEFIFKFEQNDYEFHLNENPNEQTNIYTNDFNNTEKILRFHHSSSVSNQIVFINI
jgi:hypothetical protein